MLRRLYRTEYSFRSPQFADGFLTAAGVFSILVLANFLYHYGWVADRQFTSTAGMVWYFAPPAVMASICFGALRLTSTHKQAVSILCLALAVLLYASDIALEIMDRTENGFLNRLARTRSSATADTRDVNEMVAALRRKGVPAVRAITTPITPYHNSAAVPASSEGQTRASELMPVSGIALRPMVTCRDADRWLVYNTDEHGFHNPLGLWTSNHVDIAAVGNSLTMGSCVPFDRNFVSLIRLFYPSTLNLGMNGEGPLQILAITKEYLSVLQPKILIWFYFEGNSLRELQDERKHALLLRYLNRDFTQGLIGRQGEIDQALRAVAEEQAREPQRARDDVANVVLATLHRVSKLTSLRNAFGLVYGTNAEAQSALADLEGPIIELFGEIMTRMKDQVSSWGGTLLFAYLPSNERYATWSTSPLNVESQQATKVLQLVREEGIPIIDLRPVFQSRGISLFEQGRFNEEGHRLIARHVLDAVSSLPLNVRLTK